MTAGRHGSKDVATDTQSDFQFAGCVAGEWERGARRRGAAAIVSMLVPREAAYLGL